MITPEELHDITLAFGIDSGGYEFTDGLVWKGRETTFAGHAVWEDPDWGDLGMQDLEAVKALREVSISGAMVLDFDCEVGDTFPVTHTGKGPLYGKVEAEWVCTARFHWSTTDSCFVCAADEDEDGGDDENDGDEDVCSRCGGEEKWWEGTVSLFYLKFQGE